MFQELEDEVVGRSAARAVEDRGDRRHRECVERHPAGGVGLFEPATDRQVGAVDRADVVEAEEATFEQVRPVGVLEVDPPGEVHEQLVEHPLEEVDVLCSVDGEHLERGPRLHRRVDVAEVPFVGGQGAIRVLEPFAAEQQQLVLGELRVEVGEGHAVEAEVPRREPRVLPRVGHRHDVERLEVRPAGVACRAS